MGKRIMVAHRVDYMRQMTEDVLSKNGYEVAFTRMGKECVKLCRKMKPDMVIMDAYLADGTDYAEILPALRQENPSVKVVICAWVEDSVLMDIIRKGANDFLRWPCSPEQLLNAAKVHIG